MKKSEVRQNIEYFEYYKNKHPLLFKIRLIIHILTGYLYLFFILAALLFVFWFTFSTMVWGYDPTFIIIVIPTVILIYYTAKSIMKIILLRVEKPKGVRIRSNQAPELFEMINFYRKQLKSPKLHQVLLNHEMNAYVLQAPKLGVFGLHTNYLVIGMPLLILLSKEQFEAVLVHELGHVSRSHGKFSCWIGTVSQTWDRLIDQLSYKSRIGRALYRSFFIWFISLLNIYTFILKRENEYQADEIAAQFTSSKSIIDSLAIINIMEQYMNYSFWKDYYLKSLIYEKPYPIHMYYKESFQKGIPHQDIERLLMELKNIPTGYADTHPSYSDRAKALSYSVDQPSFSNNGVFKEIFMDNLEYITNKLEEQWQTEVGDIWKQERLKRIEAQKELSELSNTEDFSNTKDTKYKTAHLSELIYGVEYAYPLYCDALLDNAFHPETNLVVGKKLILQGEERGMKLIERAIERSPDCIPEGTELIFNYLLRQGKISEAVDYERRMETLLSLFYETNYVRSNLLIDDYLIAHDLSQNKLDLIREAIQKYKFINKIIMLKKGGRDYSKENIYVMFIITKRFTFFRINKLKEFIKVIGKITPKHTIFIDFNKLEDRRLHKKVKGEINGAKINNTQGTVIFS